jgi:outer membrane protein TolC
MIRKLPMIFVAVVTSWGASSPGSLTIEQAVNASKSQPSAEDLNVFVAESRIRFLESMGRRRVDLSPQLGLLAAVNPFAALMNAGAGLLVKQGSVSPVMILDARADLLAAQIAQRRRAFQREMEATSRFYDLAEGQRTAEAACAAMEEATTRRQRVEKELAASRVTQAELIRHELAILDRESQCIEAEQRRQAASKRLGTWVGNSESEFRAVVHLPSQRALDVPLREVPHLMRVAMIHRSEPAATLDDVDMLRKQVLALRPPSMLQQATGGSQHLTGAALESGRIMVLAKLKKLDREKEELEIDMRDQVAQMKLRFESQRNQLAVAKRRLALTRELSQAATARYKAGLEPVSSRDSAESAEFHAVAAYQRLDGESRFTLAALMSVCGLRPDESTQQFALISEPSSVLSASLP